MNNYRMIISYSTEKQLFVARAPELESCSAEAASRAEAIAKLEEEMGAQIENMKAQEIDLPLPIDEQELPESLTLKLSNSLHRDLLSMAKAEGVELESLLVELLARGVQGRGRGGFRPRTEGGPRRHQEGQGQRYHNIMENRADFIEYVRSLETGKAPGTSPRGGGSRGPNRGRR
jgi:predicted RNase H-like HicB family nuclease